MKLWKKIFFKSILNKQIEKLKLQNEKMKLKSVVIEAKRQQKGKEIQSFIKTADQLDQLKEIIHAPENPIMQFLNTQAGQTLATALISKFGGGKGAAAANNLETFLQNATPEQKTKGLKLIQEILNNGLENNPISG